MDWPELMVFIRHGEAHAGVNCSLTNKGIWQATITGVKVRERYGDFDVYFASELKRSQETIILGFPDKKLIIDPRLNEDAEAIIRGSQVDAAHDLATKVCNSSYRLPEPLKEESEIDVRLGSFLTDLCKHYTGKKVLVGAHWGVMTSLYDEMREIGFAEKIRDVYDKNCSVAIYHKGEDGKLVQDESNLVFY